MKIRYLLSSMLAITLAVCLSGCSGSGSGKGKQNGIPLAQIQKSQYGIAFVDVKGKIIIDSKEFGSAEQFSEGLCAVYDKDREKVGFINTNGKLVIPCEFEHPAYSSRVVGLKARCREMFHCGYARVASSGDDVLIDRKGKTYLEGLFPIDWDGTVAIVCKDDIHEPGLVTMKGKEIVPYGTYYAMEFMGEGMIRVFGEQGVGIIDTKGKVLVDKETEEASDLPYLKVGDFVDGYVTVMLQSGDWRVMDKTGKVVQNFPKYVGNTRTFDGQLPIFEDGYLIYENMICNSAFEPIAEYPPKGLKANSYAFVDGMASVYEGTLNDPKLGFVNTKGELAVPCLYSKTKPFSDGLAFVKDSEGWHIIDKKGNVCGTLQMEGVSEYMLGNFCAERAVIGDKTVVDKSGAIVEMPETEGISDFYYSGNDNSRTTEEL